MRKLVCPSFFTMNYDENSKDFGKRNHLTNKHICIIEGFNDDGTIKGQVIKTVADRKGKLYKGNCPVPLNPGNYYFYVSDKEAEDINNITKILCTDEIEITNESEQSVELPPKEKIIDVNAYIIEGTYWDNYWDKPNVKILDKDWMKNWDKEPVKKQFDVTEIIFNEHFQKYNYNIRIKFKISYHIIANEKLIKIELSGNVMEKLNNSGIDTSMSTFNYIFNNMITDPKIKEGFDYPAGTIIDNTTTAIISSLAITTKTTTAHETGHILGLPHSESDDVNNLMYLDSTNKSRDVNEITLTPEQIIKVNDNLLLYPQ